MATGQSDSITKFVDAQRVKHVLAAVEPRTLWSYSIKSHTIKALSFTNAYGSSILARGVAK
jgi:hypothetical protein